MRFLLLLTLLCHLWGQGIAHAEEVDDADFSNPSSDVGNESSVATDATMETPTYFGSGCRPGTADVLLSPDKKTLTLLFNELGLFVEEGDKTRRLQTNCEVVLPFRVPAGMSVSIVRLDYRGYNYIAESPASVTYQASYFLTGLKKNGKITKLSRRKKKFVGPLDEEFFLSSRIRTNQHESRCGEDFDFHIQNEIMVDRKNTTGEVEATIDSLDGSITTGVKYFLNWKKCGDGKGPKKEGPKKNNPGKAKGRRA